MAFGPVRQTADDYDEHEHEQVNAPLLPLGSPKDDDDDDEEPTNPRTSRWRESPEPTALQRIIDRCSPKFSPSHSGYRGPARRSVRRRAMQCTLALVVTPLVLLVCSVLWWGGLPHSYRDIRQFERSLPQHRWGDVVVDSSGELVEKHSRRKVDLGGEAGDGYLRFPNHLWGHGFNNILEERLLAAQLAHGSNRAYVFEDYVWSHLVFPFTLYDFALRPARIPLNAFLSGFIAGANVSTAKEPMHLSIAANYYEYVCPPSLSEEHRLVLSVDDSPNFSDGISQMDWWVDTITTRGKGKRCVEIREGDVSGNNGRRLFDFNFFGSRAHVAPLVPRLMDSPVLRHFAWSKLVDEAVDETLDVLGLAPSQDSAENTTVTTIPGLLAIHLRRGDYSRHCARLARYHSGYMGFNLAEGVMDQLDLDEAVREAERGSQDAAAHGAEGRTLAKRWYYWGRSGLQLPPPPVPSPIPRHRPRPTNGDSSAAGKGGGGVRFKKDFDFSKGRGRLGESWQQVVVVSEGEEVVEVKKMTTTKASAPWMWWGTGVSGKGSIGAGSPSATEDLERRSFEDGYARREPQAEEERRREAIIERYYFKHCLPTIDQIVQRANQVRADYEPRGPLSKILLLSNGWPSFLLDLAAALEKAGWAVVDTDESVRKGVEAAAQKKDVDVAVDMALAQRAEVFLGNGFSTLSANVVLLRMMEKGSMGGGSSEPERNRLL